MSFNRLADMRFDSLNPRTRERHLPKGVITPQSVWWFVSASSALFIFSAYMLNRLCLILSPFFLLFLLLYSYAKRFTWASHLWLGVSLGLAPLGAWTAIQGRFALLPIVLGIGVSFWVAGFDIIYACLDYDFDKNIGLYSIPKNFGIFWALIVSILFHIVTVICFLLVGVMADLGALYVAGCILTILFLIYEHLIVRPGDLSRVEMSFFTMNGIVSIVLSITAIGAILIKGAGIDIGQSILKNINQFF